MKLANVLPYIVIVILCFFLFRKGEEEPKRLPVKIVTTLPSSSGSLIPIVYDSPKPTANVVTGAISTFDSEYYQKYKELKDSIDKNKFVEEFTKLRTYRDSISDSLVTVTIESEVYGYLKKTSADYTLHEREVKTEVEVPIKEKSFNIAIGAEVGIPMTMGDFTSYQGVPYYMNKSAVIKGNLILKFKKFDISTSYDTEERFWIGGNINLF